MTRRLKTAHKNTYGITCSATKLQPMTAVYRNCNTLLIRRHGGPYHTNQNSTMGRKKKESLSWADAGGPAHHFFFMVGRGPAPPGPARQVSRGWVAAQPGPYRFPRMGRGPTQPLTISYFHDPARPARTNGPWQALPETPCTPLCFYTMFVSESSCTFSPAA